MAIEHPNYYTDKKIEVIDYIKDTLTEDEYIGFCIGNVMKYISRWRKKGGQADLKKAYYYMKEAVEVTGEDKGGRKCMADNEIMSELNILIEDIKNKILNDEFENSSINLFTQTFNTKEDLKYLESNYKNNMKNICNLIRNAVLEKVAIDKLGDTVERN